MKSRDISICKIYKFNTQAAKRMVNQQNEKPTKAMKSLILHMIRKKQMRNIKATQNKIKYLCTAVH